MNRLSYRVMRPKRYDIIVFEKETGNYNINASLDCQVRRCRSRTDYIYINNEKLDAPERSWDKGRLWLDWRNIRLVWIKTNIFLLGDKPLRQ